MVELLLYSIAEVAQTLNVSSGTIRNMIRDGSLKAVYVRTRHLVPHDEVMRLAGKGSQQEVNHGLA